MVNDRLVLTCHVVSAVGHPQELTLQGGGGGREVNGLIHTIMLKNLHLDDS